MSDIPPKRTLLTKRNAIVAILTAIYGISPIDAVPDLVPLLGQLDDVGVILFAIALIIKWYRDPPKVKPLGKTEPEKKLPPQ